MPANVYTMEAVNLVCGDTGTEASAGRHTHLQIAELKLPGIEENYVDYTPGGAITAIEIPTHFQKLEATFNLNGWQPEIMGLLGQNNPELTRFTAYGLVRDRRSGGACQSVAVLWGRLGRVNPSAFRRGDLMVHEYSIRGIIHYDLRMSLKPKQEPSQIYYWNFFESRFEVYLDGKAVDLLKDMRTVLNLPNVSPPTEVLNA